MTSTYPPLGSNGLKTYPGLPGTGLAVGNWAWVLGLRGLGDGLDLSVTVAGEDRGVALGFALERGGFWGGGTVTVRPGVVTASEATVVVVVVVSFRPSIWRRT